MSLPFFLVYCGTVYVRVVSKYCPRCDSVRAMIREAAQHFRASQTYTCCEMVAARLATAEPSPPSTSSPSASPGGLRATLPAATAGALRCWTRPNCKWKTALSWTEIEPTGAAAAFTLAVQAQNFVSIAAAMLRVHIFQRGPRVSASVEHSVLFYVGLTAVERLSRRAVFSSQSHPCVMPFIHSGYIQFSII